MQSGFGKKGKRWKSKFAGKKYFIARSFAKDDDTYGLHRTGMGVYSNEFEMCSVCVIVEFYAGSTP